MQVPRQLILIAGFVGALLMGVWLGQSSWRENPAHSRIWAEICRFTASKIYLPHHRLEPWLRNCVHLSHVQSMSRWTSSEFVAEMNMMFQELQVSHLTLLEPAGREKYWENTAVDTGLRARRVDGNWYIIRVEKGSIAEQQGLKVGDQVRGINGYEVRFGLAIEMTSGVYQISRQGKLLEILVKAAPLRVDSRPHVIWLDHKQAVLTIPNFLPVNFSEMEYKALWQQVSHAERLIIDLRDNQGGNFVAMLRALSPFFCAPTPIGEILRSKSKMQTQTRLEDNIGDDTQIDIFESFDRVELFTFAEYGCYDKPIVVLINENTSSTAEIFAQSLKARPRTLIAGTPSAGKVVLSMWYPVPNLGWGFVLSIPEAEFRDVQGALLEGLGVQPARYLYYQENEARQGVDSWIKAVSK